MNAWHDYFTDNGGEGGCPDLEEEIDVTQLLQTRSWLHEIVMNEIKLLDDDPKRVFIGGASQGGCTALDVALTLPVTIGGQC